MKLSHISLRQRLLKWSTVLMIAISTIFSNGCAPALSPTAISMPPTSTLAISPPTLTPEPTQVGAFTSSFYGYSLKLPEGWRSSASATRVMISGELPWAGESWVDTFRGPGQKDFMVVAAQALVLGTSLEEWAEMVIDLTPDCKRPAPNQTNTELGGEPAIVVVDGGCFGIVHYWMALLHAGRGYQVAWAGDRQQFEEVRASFTFTP